MCFCSHQADVAHLAATDECEPPSNFKQLADHTGFGLNVNGSVCLNNICMYVLSSLFVSFSER